MDNINCVVRGMIRDRNEFPFAVVAECMYNNNMVTSVDLFGNHETYSEKTVLKAIIKVIKVIATPIAGVYGMKIENGVVTRI